MKNNRQYIEQQIEAYFDCTLTERQEQELRRLLAETELDTESVREAQAVMGLFAVARKKRTAPVRLLRYAAAACLVVGVALTATLFVNRQANDICIMYANGQRIDNAELVLAQMNSELSNIHSADMLLEETFLGELQSIGAALK